MAPTTVRVHLDNWHNLMGLLRTAGMGANIKTSPESWRPAVIAVLAEDASTIRAWNRALKSGADVNELRASYRMSIFTNGLGKPSPVLVASVKVMLANWGWTGQLNEWDQFVAEGLYGGLPEGLGERTFENCSPQVCWLTEGLLNKTYPSKVKGLLKDFGRHIPLDHPLSAMRELTGDAMADAVETYNATWFGTGGN